MSSKIPTISDKTKNISVMLLSSLGLVVSVIIYLFIENEPTNNIPACTVGTLFNCGDVVNSEFGKVFGIHLSIIGAFYFLVILALYLVDYYDDYLMAGISVVGVLSVVYFVVLELFILQKFCLYCTVVHVSVILIFLLIGPSSIRNSVEKLKKR